MIVPGYTVLLADPDARMRSLISAQLGSIGCTLLEAEDGNSALRAITSGDVRVVIAELYLQTGEDDCLIHAIRRAKELRKTRALALTRYATAVDRDWAMRAGADAFLIKPTRAERLRYVVTRLATATKGSGSVPVTSSAAILRRDSLDAALAELEAGSLAGTSSIIFGREWWEQLPRADQTRYRGRAKKAGVSLRSDSNLSAHFVEVRGPAREDQGLSTERPESPYRR